jgi:PAS domain S-box-containing protein
MWVLRRRAAALLLAATAVACVVLFVIAVTHAPLRWPSVVASTGTFTLLVLLLARWAHVGILAHETVVALERQSVATAASSGGWVYATDRDGVFLYSSDASREYLGYEPGELVGREARSLLSATEPGHVESRASDSSGHVDVMVMRGRHRDGRDSWFEVTVAPILGADGHGTVGYGGTARLVNSDQHPAVVRELHRREISELLRSENLKIAFQPIVELATGHVVGVEALSRFPTRPDVTPDVVFSDAANAGLGSELELLAVRRALEESRLLDPSLHVAINVSPFALADPALIDALKASGVDLTRVVVEVTEHASVTDYSTLERARQRLRDLGVRLAVDDAGAGYSSLRHIVTLSPDIIKIDRALVANLDTDRARRALVMAVVVYALEIGTTMVVAEGVETTGELETLRSLGVDAVQGYLTGAPTTCHEAWFKRGVPEVRTASGLGRLGVNDGT